MNISEDLIGRLRSAKHVLVFTGAGVSAESGIPTFRDALTGLEELDDGQLHVIATVGDTPQLQW